MKKFEYKVSPSRIKENCNPKDVELHFDNLGKTGWELCGMEHGFCVYKREVPADDGIS